MLLSRRTDVNPLLGIIGIVALTVALVIVWWFAFWAPSLSKKTQLLSSMVQQEERITQLEREKVAIVGTRRQIEQLNKSIGEWGQQFPDSKVANRIFTELTVLARSYGLRAVRMKPWLQPGETPHRSSGIVGGYLLERVPVTILLEGRYVGVSHFIERLPQLPYRVVLQEMKLKAAAGSSNVYVLLDLYLYFRKG
ncbi:MAG: type 4a pilus biogenesis protein PilO [bacterium]|nr:type 4a pilus biogenesis protein PilO [bacterium]